MDLKECGDCGKPISPRAYHCPNCGAPGYSTGAAPVSVVDLNIGFGNMVGMMIKFAFAVIPALIIIITVSMIIWAVLGSMITGKPV